MRVKMAALAGLVLLGADCSLVREYCQRVSGRKQSSAKSVTFPRVCRTKRGREIPVAPVISKKLKLECSSVRGTHQFR